MAKLILVACSIVMVVLANSGCGPGTGLTGPVITLQKLTDDVSGGDPPFCSLQGLKIDGRAVNSLGSRQQIETTGAVLVHVFQDMVCDYDVLFGADSTPGSVSRGSIHNTAPTVHIEDGWAVMWGENLKVATDPEWVSGGADGTLLIVQRVGSDLLRLYLTSENAATAKVYFSCHGGSVQYVDTPGWYAEIDKTCAVTKTAVAAAPPDVQAFVDKAKSIASQVGYPLP